jgi:hypothetical protein
VASAIRTYRVPQNGRLVPYKCIACEACRFRWEVPATMSAISRGDHARTKEHKAALKRRRERLAAQVSRA